MTTRGIGRAAMGAVLDVTDELGARVRDRFGPGEGVYRINDFGEYVSEADWLDVWADRPAWWPKAWMLADNGQYRADEVACMSVPEIEARFADPGFYPEHAYYTEADGEGLP